MTNTAKQLTDGTQQQPSVQAELHVGRSTGLGTGGGDVLTDIRRGDEDLSEGDRVVGEEEHREQVLGLGVFVDDACSVDDEADSLKTF